jgi:nucleolin
MVTSEGNGEDESGSSSEMHIDLGGKKAADTKGVKRKREDNGDDEEGNKKRKLNNGGGGNTKVRLGNLAFDLDGQIDEVKKQFADCGKIKNVEMITRKDGRFAGVAIIEFEDTDAAASALEKHDQDFYGRKMNLSYSTEESGGGGRPQRGGGFNRPPSEKPEGCTTCFIGNLSYDITEDQVYEFFSDCGNIKQVRWPQGDFTGIGWVEFYDTNGPDMAIAKAGQELLGRSIRVDFAAPRKPRF